MKNLNLFTHLLLVGLMILAFSFQSTNAQGIDLSELKSTKEAEAIKKYTDLLSDFYIRLYQAIGERSKSLSSGKVAGAGLKDRAAKIRSEAVSNFDNLQSLIAKLKSANRFNEQFDKDVAKLLGSNKVKSRLAKSGGARKLLESVLNSGAANNLKSNVSEAAETIEFTKNEDVCKFLAIGIVAEVLSAKKSTTANDKIYEANGCHK